MGFKLPVPCARLLLSLHFRLWCLCFASIHQTNKTSFANGLVLLPSIQGQVQGGGLCPVCGHNVPGVCQARHQQHLSDDPGGSLHCAPGCRAKEVGTFILPAHPSGCPWAGNIPASGVFVCLFVFYCPQQWKRNRTPHIELVSDYWIDSTFDGLVQNVNDLTSRKRGAAV